MSRVIYILGTGPSINNITEDEWEYLKNQYTISMSTFPLSGKKTTGYYSHERIKLDSEMLNVLADYGYLDTRLFISHVDSIELAKTLGFKYIQPIYKQNALFKGRPWYMDMETPPLTFKQTRAMTFGEPIFRFRGQVTGAINVALLLKATEIRLIGIDLISSRSFWESEEMIKRWIDPKYLPLTKSLYDEGTRDTLSKIKNNPMMKDFDENTMHVTEIPYSNPNIFGDKQLRRMSDVIQWMDKELVSEGKSGIYNCSKISLLNSVLRYKPIMEN